MENHNWQSKSARFMLRAGEYLEARFAGRVIVISRVIQEIGRKRCRKTPRIINKGVPVPNLSTGKDFLDRLEASPGRYILAVSRFVAEKGLDLLLTALQAQRPAWKLVIAGDAVHHTNYSRELKALIDADDTIIRTGHITGERLNQVFTHAGLFVLPSYHEGLPIALLEAMSYGLSVLVSDIPANKEVDLSAERFFKSGDMADLREKLQHLLETGISEDEKSDYQRQLAEKYNWNKIAGQTIGVYEKVLGGEIWD